MKHARNNIDAPVCIRSGRESANLDRRAFISLSAGALGAAALGLFPSSAVAQKGGAVTRYPLYIPPVVSAPSAFGLTAAQSSVNIGGKSALALGYNDSLPGPTFVADRGSWPSVRLENRLTQDTTIHWHGMIVPPEQDGHPHDVVTPGNGRTYSFQVNQRAALNWYHPHTHMLTGEQVCLGLAGAFVVRDNEELSLGLPDGQYEIPLVIRDTNLDKRGNFIYNPRSSGFVGSMPMVNGTRNPKLLVDKAIYRFRMLNGANARIFKLALNNGAPINIIGNDGGLLEFTEIANEIEFGNGERLDLLVDFRGLNRGQKIMLRDLNAGWDFLEFESTGNSGPQYVLPVGRLSTITPLSNPVRTREFNFEGMSRINGLEYDMHRIDFQVPFDETELWRFSTGGNAPHPVHVHGASFQVVSRSGGRGQLYPWEKGWKDTVLLLDRETVEVRIRFDGYRGLYLMHCHKLEHEDMGMMSNFEVI